MDTYDDPRFGVEQCLDTDVTGALNSTVGETALFRYVFKKAVDITAIYARFKAGGTAATRQILVGTAAAAASAVAIGTAVLGTQATNTTKSLSITGSVDAGGELVFSHLGTDAIVYNVSFQVFYKEKFANV